MSSFEQETVAPALQLQNFRSATETYETFYQLYGQQEIQRHGFRTILNRVLHIDETEDRSHHFVVAQADTPQSPIRRQYDPLGAPMHYVPYNTRDLMVASTDGMSIAQYEVLGVHGIYRAHLNTTDQQYNPIHEKMELRLRSGASKQLVTARFNLATGDGAVYVDRQPCGWILSESESARIRDIILTPALVNGIGHTAVAS